MRKYTASEATLRRLARRLLCQQDGHDPLRSQTTQFNGELLYSCDRCDAKFKVEYPPLDFAESET